MNILNSSLRKFFLVAAAGAAIALLPTRASAQEVDFTTMGFSGSATNPFDLADGVGSQATGGGTAFDGSTAIGANAFALGAGSTTVGANAGVSNNPGQTMLGANAGNTFTGTGTFSITIGAGVSGGANFTTAPSALAEAIAIGSGNFAAQGAIATGTSSIALGSAAFSNRGAVSSGANSVAIGGASATATGATASGANSISIGVGSRSTGTNGIAMGNGAVAGPGANTIAIGTGATATNSVAIGAGATAANGGAAYGDGSTATGTNNSVAVGTNSTSTGAASIATGSQSSATGTGAIAIGGDSNNGGVSAVASNTGSLAFGGDTLTGIGPSSTGVRSMAIGDGSLASATNAIAFGTGANASFANSAAFGAGATSTRANQQVFGTATNTYTMPGITSAASAAAQTGPLAFVTSDGTGNLAVTAFSPASIINRLDFLDSRITHVRNEARGGVALAIASGQIRYDDRPGKLSFGGGVGEFLDNGGGALGIGYTTEGGRVRLNVMGAGSTHGDFGAGGGISFTLN